MKRPGGAQELCGRRVVVVGLGRSGLAAARFLRAVGAEVTVTDRAPRGTLAGADELEALGVRVEAGGHGGGTVAGAELVVTSPGVARDAGVLDEARRAGAEVIGELELAWRCIDEPVAAVAGTNGKSTTTALLGAMLEAAGMKVFVGGNIGTPLIEYAASGEKADICVVEVSSFQLETVSSFRPRVAVLLNITEDHLDRYEDFDDYARTKMRLFENQGPGDFAVVNRADPVVMGLVGRMRPASRLIGFGGRPGADGVVIEGGRVVFRLDGREESMDMSRFGLAGAHNRENLAAAFAAAMALGAAARSAERAAAAFRGLPHRMELVGEFGGVRYYDDSKATNVGAVVKTLEGIDGPVVLIAGGRNKGGDFSPLREAVKGRVKLTVLIGEARCELEAALSGAVPTRLAGGMAEAVAAAREAACAGDTVLLSPACASFDMYRGFEERGEHFKEVVEASAAEAGRS